MYARGILFGKMVIELGDNCTAKCEKLGMTADIEFRTKVYHPFALLPVIFHPHLPLVCVIPLLFAHLEDLLASDLSLRLVFCEIGLLFWHI